MSALDLPPEWDADPVVAEITKATERWCFCGQLVRAHARCGACGVLVGEGHPNRLAAAGLCGECWRVVERRKARRKVS